MDINLEAQWVSPKGVVYTTLRHVDFIRDNAELFGWTKEYYWHVYDEMFHEKRGQEGKAREFLIIEALKKGWMRVRNYYNRGWSLEVWELDDYAKNNIFKWAGKITGLIKEDNYSNVNDVNIHVIKLERDGKPTFEWYIKTTTYDILKGSLFENFSVKKFKDFNI